MSEARIDEARRILTALEMPAAQCNERAALALLALVDLAPNASWATVRDPLIGVTPIMEFAAVHYGKLWKPNTRETIRRQTLHQFLDAGLVVANPDFPERAVNSPRFVYQIEPKLRELLRTFDTPDWEDNLSAYKAIRQSLKSRYARERVALRIPVQIATGATLTLSPGGQNVLIQKILEDFAPIFTPNATLVYVGDADEKFSYFDEAGLAGLGVEIEQHGKMPDVILFWAERNWLILLEAVTSHGPIHSQRRDELTRLFSHSTAGLVFVTAFLDRQTFKRYLTELAWETEVWIAETPTHMVHFNGSRFLGPYEETR